MAESETNIDKSEAARLLAGERKIRTGNCLHCGVEYQGTGRKKYCSDTHTQAAYYERTVKKKRGEEASPLTVKEEVPLEPPKRPSSLGSSIDRSIARLPIEKQALANRLIGGVVRQIIRDLKK